MENYTFLFQYFLAIRVFKGLEQWVKLKIPNAFLKVFEILNI